MTKPSPQKTRITKEEIIDKIYKKFPSLKLFPTCWSIGKKYPKRLTRDEIILIATELKIILRITKCLVKHKDKYTLEETIIFKK